jgi:hypothetical protein
MNVAYALILKRYKPQDTMYLHLNILYVCHIA